jgi:multicomponent Na+:H+ antiporter subunit F
MNPTMQTMLSLVIALLMVSLIMVIVRLLRGPSVPDRAVALDQIAIHVTGLIAVYSVLSNQPILTDLILVTSIIGFISVVVLGVYIERTIRGKARATDIVPQRRRDRDVQGSV